MFADRDDREKIFTFFFDEVQGIFKRIEAEAVFTKLETCSRNVNIFSEQAHWDLRNLLK